LRVLIPSVAQPTYPAGQVRNQAGAKQTSGLPEEIARETID